MTDLNNKCFSIWNESPDDSPFVHQAMSALGFLCAFSQLSLEQQQLALALAQCFKCDQKTAEAYES